MESMFSYSAIELRCYNLTSLNIRLLLRKISNHQSIGSRSFGHNSSCAKLWKQFLQTSRLTPKATSAQALVNVLQSSIERRKYVHNKLKSPSRPSLPSNGFRMKSLLRYSFTASPTIIISPKYRPLYHSAKSVRCGAPWRCRVAGFGGNYLFGPHLRRSGTFYATHQD